MTAGADGRLEEHLVSNTRSSSFHSSYVLRGDVEVVIWDSSESRKSKVATSDKALGPSWKGLLGDEIFSRSSGGLNSILWSLGSLGKD